MPNSATILTLGYGTRSVDDLIRTIREAGVTVLVEVRSAPYSKRRPEFVKRALAEWVPAMGVRYLFAGDALGGMPTDPGSYLRDKLVPERRWKHPDFVAGIERLRGLLAAGEVACLMCAEEDPARCHRFHLLGEALQAAGVEVRHLRADGTSATQAEIRRALDGPQLGLFST
jgi:ATP-dependent DNA helicase RecQ